MCFSAPASFIGGAVLTGLGTLTMMTNRDPSKRFFAAIPFVFGLQQLSEGVVWLTLPGAASGAAPDHDLIYRLAVTVFLIAATVLWPTLVPLSVLLMEKRRPRRAFLWATLGIGAAVSLAHAVGMALYDIHAEILGFHIRYYMDSPHPFALAAMTGYLIATIVPFFLSSVKRVPVFGLIIVVSYVVAEIFYREFLVSVWCFFAATASVTLVWVLRVPLEAAKRAKAASADADEDEAAHAKV